MLILLVLGCTFILYYKDKGVYEEFIKDEFTYINDSTDLTELKLYKVHWTSVNGTNENTVYHFVSAYFDNRSSASNRPAVIVIGYANITVVNIDLYCVFRYADGRRECQKKPLTRKNVDCYEVKRVEEADRMHFICPVSPGKEPPVSVMISNVSTCIPAFSSGELPVGNRVSTVPKKKFGVCLQGVLVQNDHHYSDFLWDVIGFIEMSQLLGAELITLYASPLQVDIRILKHLLRRFPETVRIVEWKKFDAWYPLHYYGQYLLISDCLYRNMYKVEYLVMMDLDEMVLPIMHGSWSEMVSYLDRRNNYGTFRYKSNYFLDVKTSTPELEALKSNCINQIIPKYFKKVTDLKCSVLDGWRAKLIVKTKSVVIVKQHSSCEAVAGVQQMYEVPDDVGILAHYRLEKLEECSGADRKRPFAMKFAKRYFDKYCRQS